MLRIMTLEEGERGPLGEGRGEKIKLINEHLGTTNIDVHYNILRPGGAEGRYHRHSKSDNVYIVARGTGDLKADGKFYKIHAGSIVFIPAGMPHSLSNLTEESFEIYEIYAPAGPDFDFELVED